MPLAGPPAMVLAPLTVGVPAQTSSESPVWRLIEMMREMV